jgi:hypothetical protein
MSRGGGRGCSGLRRFGGQSGARAAIDLPRDEQHAQLKSKFVFWGDIVAGAAFGGARGSIAQVQIDQG